MDLTKFKQSELSSVKKELIKRQKGLCPICHGSLLNCKPINVVVDHDHSTGVVRAALHRGCNGLDGKILRFLKTWGKAASTREAIQVLDNLVKFWRLHDSPQTEWIYYGHKTATEKRLATNKKRRLAAKKKREK